MFPVHLGFPWWCWLAVRADRAAVSMFCHIQHGHGTGWADKDVLAELLLKSGVAIARVCKSLEVCPCCQGYSCRAWGTFVFLIKIFLGVFLFLLSVIFAFSCSWVTFQGWGFFCSAEGRKLLLTTQRLRSLCNPLCSYWEFRQSMDHDDSRWRLQELAGVQQHGLFVPPTITSVNRFLSCFWIAC